MNRPAVPNKNNHKTKSVPALRKHLGPVRDLEKHVHPDWWRKIFNSIYLKTDADVVDDSNITSEEIDLFAGVLNLSADDRILDVCCGQGRHVSELYRRGFKNAEGLDRSHYLIQKARTRARKEGLSIKFREGDARKMPYQPDTFDTVTILGNSFGYFETMNDDINVLKEVFRILKPWGKLLIDIADGQFIREKFQPRSWEWIDKKHLVTRERSLSLDKERLISREVVIHVEKGVIVDQFYGERLYSRDELKELLASVGFSDITVHSEIATESQRNQDLGMMEQRLIISALVKKDWTPVKRKPTEQIKRVTVVLGDPNKQDPMKPSAVFDDDDFYTIDQLKDALRGIKGYDFTYMNNHDTLFADLEKNRGKIDYVFNLCDEGYYNDPIKELHVPAILEILKIPYTGSDPQCLAYCYDKSLIRGIAKEMKIPVPEAFFINPEDTTFELPFGFPVIVKPNFGDSSFGITQRSVAYNLENLLDAITEIRQKLGYEKPLLVEELLTGKDLSVGIIGNPPESYMVLPIIEEDYSALPEGLPRICGYEAKWDPDSPYWKITSVPANLPEDVEKMMSGYCTQLCDRLEVRDYCRFDWRLDSAGNPKLLEVNPNPGWCWDGHLAKMAKLSGMDYRKMLAAILEAGEQRMNIAIRLQKSA